MKTKINLTPFDLATQIFIYLHPLMQDKHIYRGKRVKTNQLFGELL